VPANTPPQPLPLEIGDDRFDAVHVHGTFTRPGAVAVGYAAGYGPTGSSARMQNIGVVDIEP
jgi:hypothetical protein